MDTQDYLDAIREGVNTLGMEWTTTVKGAAKWKAHTLTKVTRAVCLTGVEYRNLAVNAEVETGALPWGEWAQYPYVIRHAGRDYLRVYTVDGTVQTRYAVDGIDVFWSEFSRFLTPSQREAKRPNGGVLTIKAENMRIVDTPALALGGRR
jgi:hypothetical protein